MTNEDEWIWYTSDLVNHDVTSFKYLVRWKFVGDNKLGAKAEVTFVELPECYKEKPKIISRLTAKIHKCSACSHAWFCENAFKEEQP